MLNLFNQALRNVNPYHPDLSQDTKEAILNECKANPDYFFKVILGKEVISTGVDTSLWNYTDEKPTGNELFNINHHVCKVHLPTRVILSLIRADIKPNQMEQIPNTPHIVISPNMQIDDTYIYIATNNGWFQYVRLQPTSTIINTRATSHVWFGNDIYACKDLQIIGIVQYLNETPKIIALG